MSVKEKMVEKVKLSTSTQLAHLAQLEKGDLILIDYSPENSIRRDRKTRVSYDLGYFIGVKRKKGEIEITLGDPHSFKEDGCYNGRKIGTFAVLPGVLIRSNPERIRRLLSPDNLGYDPQFNVEELYMAKENRDMIAARYHLSGLKPNMSSSNFYSSKKTFKEL